MFDYTHWRTQAAGRVNADGTVTSPGTVFGCSVAKNAGNGSYRITVFDSTLAGVPEGAGLPVPEGRLLIFVTALGTTPRAHAADDVAANGNQKDVTIATDAGVLVDNEFVFIIGYFLPAS